jgi:hypothetical protein
MYVIGFTWSVAALSLAAMAYLVVNIKRRPSKGCSELRRQ